MLNFTDLSPNTQQKVKTSIQLLAKKIVTRHPAQADTSNLHNSQNTHWAKNP